VIEQLMARSGMDLKMAKTFYHSHLTYVIYYWVVTSSPHFTIVPTDSDINDDISPPQVIIALPAVLPPSPILSLSPMFDSRDSFPSEKISSPKDNETPISPSSSVESSSPIRSTTPPPESL
ncbi:hypothetical protein Tco_0860282, partial [Tanacetum coccineum]